MLKNKTNQLLTTTMEQLFPFQIFLFLFVNAAYSYFTKLKKTDDANISEQPKKKIEIKYEDKYLDKFHSISTSVSNECGRLSTCVLFESTPVGNVIMLYNDTRKVFEYYSDSSVPYRYLETVCRKYVITFNCKHLYVVMESELKKNMEESKRISEEKEEKEKKEKNNPDMTNKPKKNVFAKFKSYNKEAGTGHVNIAVPPKNSIPNLRIDAKHSNEPVVLKENVNRYSYQGKTGNYSFLKKISRRIDKNAAMTFADFKKQQLLPK
jgi:hypothetical protein